MQIMNHVLIMFQISYPFSISQLVPKNPPNSEALCNIS